MSLKRTCSVILTSALMVLLVGCMQRSSNFSGTEDDDDDTDSPFNGGGGGGGNTNVGSLTGNNGGSGTGGSLTTTDTNTIQNLFQSTANANVTPSNAAASAISSSLQTQINNLLEQRRRGIEVTAQLMGLAGQMLQECAQKVGVLAPVPGQPLLGEWASTSGDCTVNFRISGAPALQQQTTNQYAVSNGLTGTMVADQTGLGVVNANPWSGNIRDTPEIGNGVLRHPTFFPATGGKNPQPARPCETAVALKTSTNPIPANYTEASRRVGCCFRQSLMLMSPTMVQLMSSMDPRLAALLVQNSGCPSVQ